MCFGSRKPFPTPIRQPSSYTRVHQYEYGDIPSPPIPPGYTFDPYNSPLPPDRVYLVGVFLSQIVNATTRPQSRNPFETPLAISSLIFPDWVPGDIMLAVHDAIPPDLLKPEGVTLILQCPLEFAQELRNQAKVRAQPRVNVMYFGWAPTPPY